MLGDVCRRVVGGEGEVLCFPADQDEAEVHLWQQQTHLSWQKRSATQHKPPLLSSLLAAVEFPHFL